MIDIWRMIIDDMNKSFFFFNIYLQQNTGKVIIVISSLFSVICWCISNAIRSSMLEVLRLLDWFKTQGSCIVITKCGSIDRPQLGYSNLWKYLTEELEVKSNLRTIADLQTPFAWKPNEGRLWLSKKYRNFQIYWEPYCYDGQMMMV